MLAPSGFPFNPPLPRSARRGRLPPLPLPAPPLPASCPCRSLGLPAPAARRCARLCPLASAVSPLRRLLPPFLPAPAAAAPFGSAAGLGSAGVRRARRGAPGRRFRLASALSVRRTRCAALPASPFFPPGLRLCPRPPPSFRPPLGLCLLSVPLGRPLGAPRAPLATPPRPPARPPRTSRRGPALRRPAAPSLPSPATGCAVPAVLPSRSAPSAAGSPRSFLSARLRRPARPLPALSPARLGRAVAVPLALGLLRRPGRPPCPRDAVPSSASLPGYLRPVVSLPRPRAPLRSLSSRPPPPGLGPGPCPLGQGALPPGRRPRAPSEPVLPPPPARAGARALPARAGRARGARARLRLPPGQAERANRRRRLPARLHSLPRPKHAPLESLLASPRPPARPPRAGHAHGARTRLRLPPGRAESANRRRRLPARFHSLLPAITHHRRPSPPLPAPPLAPSSGRRPGRAHPAPPAPGTSRERDLRRRLPERFHSLCWRLRAARRATPHH